MTPVVSEGYEPGRIGRIVQLHASCYAATHGFGVAFEAKVARELSEFCLAYGHGVGRRFLTRALAFADARNDRKTCLWTFEGLGAARLLYESCGLQSVHQSPGTQWGTVINEQRSEREASHPC